MGTVYLGKEVATAKKVALKVFHRKFSIDQEFVDQLERRTKLAMTLREVHPRIASVYDYDRTDDGSSFVVMEYLDGKSLRDVIRQESPLDVERVLLLASQIAEGLQAAHDLGFVHTDIRPHHVMLVKEGQGEVAKLKGFEAAGLSEAGLAGNLVRAGVMPGTPEYAAPEQIEGARATPRTDIYAFGAVLYEMLSGVVPFRASTPDGVLAKQIQEMPASPKAFRPEIPSVVELKVMQALEKEPENRQRYIADVANEYLYDLAVDELAVERARRKYGVIWKLVVAVQAYIAGMKEISIDEDRLGRRWKLVVIAALLALVSVPAVWFLYSRQMAAIQPAPPLQQPLAETRALELVDRSANKEDLTEQPISPLPVETLPEPSGTRQRPPEGEKETPALIPADEKSPILSSPGRIFVGPPATKSPPQKTTRRPDRKDALALERNAIDPTQTAKAPPTPRREEPRRETESSDPTAIIDWLLKQPPGKE